jgi:hypothetical protein
MMEKLKESALKTTVPEVISEKPASKVPSIKNVTPKKSTPKNKSPSLSPWAKQLKKWSDIDAAARKAKGLPPKSPYKDLTSPATKALQKKRAQGLLKSGNSTPYHNSQISSPVSRGSNKYNPTSPFANRQSWATPPRVNDAGAPLTLSANLNNSNADNQQIYTRLSKSGSKSYRRRETSPSPRPEPTKLNLCQGTD